VPCPGKVFFCGKDTIETGDDLPFLQLVISLHTGNNGPSLQKLRSLAGDLPGYMARSRGTETSVKIHKSLTGAGFSLRHIAATVCERYAKEGFNPETLQIIIGAGDGGAIDLFSPFVDDLYSSDEETSRVEMKKILEDCTKDSDCIVCDDKPVCDNIRRILR
jgi:hypothetical protein